MCVCACEEPRGRVGGAKQTVGRARERQGERDSLEKSRHFLKLNVLRCGINLGGPAGEETLPPCSSCCVYRRQEQQTQPISGHSLSLTHSHHLRQRLQEDISRSGVCICDSSAVWVQQKQLCVSATASPTAPSAVWAQEL